MKELTANLHIHTVYSDGIGTHAEISREAIKVGLDVIITTDHNILTSHRQGYYTANGLWDGKEETRRLLLLTGEEVHNRVRKPQKSHLLVLGADRELSAYGDQPQNLINQARQSDGLSFLAHPLESALPLFGETDITWEDWEVTGYTGIELWNGLSELKSRIRSLPDAILFTLFPKYTALGPPPTLLEKWDQLLNEGRRVVAVGGADAHARPYPWGPLKPVIFPYRYHFQAINTHLLVPRLLGQDFNADRRLVINALRDGHAFVGYDLPASTRGFRFTAQSQRGTAIMGDEIRLKGGVTLQIRLPLKTRCTLICDGQPVKTWEDSLFCTHITNQPGVYRVECHILYLGRWRGWIYSNPIYVRE
jgi:hypothetical protein